MGVVSLERAAAPQLSADYLAGLSEVVRSDGPAGFARLQRLCDWLSGWYRRDDWVALWMFTKTAAEHRREEGLLLHDLATASRAGDPQALEEGLQIVVDGAAAAAALDSGERATTALAALLRIVWRQAGDAGAADDRV
jgi:hypothetical protein